MRLGSAQGRGISAVKAAAAPMPGAAASTPAAAAAAAAAIAAFTCQPLACCRSQSAYSTLARIRHRRHRQYQKTSDLFSSAPKAINTEYTTYHRNPMQVMQLSLLCCSMESAVHTGTQEGPPSRSSSSPSSPSCSRPGLQAPKPFCR